TLGGGSVASSFDPYCVRRRSTSSASSPRSGSVVRRVATSVADRACQAMVSVALSAADISGSSGHSGLHRLAEASLASRTFAEYPIGQPPIQDSLDQVHDSTAPAARTLTTTTDNRIN